MRRLYDLEAEAFDSGEAFLAELIGIAALAAAEIQAAREELIDQI